MRIEKEKMVVIFPHLPNPRMIKRIHALEKEFLLEIIYWDRDSGYEKVNKIPSHINTSIIKKKANEGNPLGRVGTTLKVFTKAIKLIKKFNPDYIYIAKTDMLTISVIYKLFFKSDTKLIYEVSDLHSLMIDKQKKFIKRVMSKILTNLEKILCKHIKVLVVTSEYFYQHFYASFVEKDKLLFIPNTPNPSLFKNFNRHTNSKYTVGFIGAVRYGEQIEKLIEAAQKININVFIAGKGKDSERIINYSKKYGNVEIYGEYEYEKEIEQLYEKVDCIYSVYDTSKKNVQIALPNRLYEALYTNTPIIAAKNTYLGEIVESFEIGKVVTANDLSELVDAINQLKTDQILKKHIAEKATTLKNRWKLEEYNKELLKIIKA